MYAARQASDETVAFLLSKGASPDLRDNSNLTALVAAILSECSSTIALLAPMTTKGLGEAVLSLAFYQAELSPAVDELLRRAASDKDAAVKGVAYAAEFGATRMLTFLTQGWDENTLDSTEANLLLEKALMTDNADTVDTIKAFVPSAFSENIVLALTRGRADVAKLFGLGEDERSMKADLATMYNTWLPGQL